MKKRKILMLIGIATILSSACLCSGVNSIVDQFPFNLKDQSPEQIFNALVEQLSGLATPAVDQLDQLKPGTDQSDQDDPNSQMDKSQSGLESLGSYHSQLVIELTGKDENGNLISETNRFVQEIIKDKQSSKVIVTNESNGKVAQQIDIYSLDGITYMLNRDKSETGESCIIMSGSNNLGEELTNLNIIPPIEMIKDIEGGNLIKNGEMINGIKTDHFSLNNAAILGALITSGKTDVWFAQNEGFLVRTIGRGEGEMTSMTIGAQVTGNIIWQYDLLNVNTLEEIVVPNICLEASLDIRNDMPILDNSDELSIFGQIIGYKTSENSENVVNFYKTEMSDKGYSITSDLSYSGLYNLTFTKDGMNVNISISADDDGGSSIIIIKE